MTKIDATTKRFLVISLSLYILIVIFLSSVTATEFATVFIGTLPLLLYMITFFVMHMYENLDHTSIWVLPFLYPLIFLGIWLSKSVDVVSGMEGPSIAVMNILFSYGANIFLILVYKINKNSENSKSSKYEKWV